jgi:hypothetical protein
MRRTVDLNSHINETVEQGSPAEFPIALRPLYHDAGGTFQEVGRRLAVVREDTGQLLSVVSNRYRLVQHQELLGAVRSAIAGLDLGPVPHGIYVDRRGARMRALFKFPSLAQPVYRADDICPCIKIENTYDATSRISVHIGAFRFVCTNLAVGGGGIFAGGFMAVHAGEIPINRIAQQLGDFLGRFDSIVAGYRQWMETEFDWQGLAALLDKLPPQAARRIGAVIRSVEAKLVYTAYNAATYEATHCMRSARAAFRLMELINASFQREYPVDNATTAGGTSPRPFAVPLKRMEQIATRVPELTSGGINLVAAGGFKQELCELLATIAGDVEPIAVCIYYQPFAQPRLPLRGGGWTKGGMLYVSAILEPNGIPFAYAGPYRTDREAEEALRRIQLRRPRARPLLPVPSRREARPATLLAAHAPFGGHTVEAP